ncbi:MAG: zinc ABC transporter substrate-binding protein [Planctomycetaceae bacterium]|nr:zinc ABC transporter substrate-binding protein [Planctomycetaceae bacterium]
MSRNVLFSRVFYMPVCLSVFYALLLVFTGCNVSSESEGTLPVVAVTVEPHGNLVERIVGDGVRCVVLVPQGKDPETYQVTPDKITALSKAKLFFRTGIPAEESLLPKLQSIAGDLQCIDLRTDLTLRKLELHHHEGEIRHIHTDALPLQNTDPHIWFAPSLLKTQALTVLNALKKLLPEKAELLQSNYEKLAAEIENLRLELVRQLEPMRGKTVFVFHPAYGYFCDEFGLLQTAIEFEGKTPNPKQIAEVIETVKRLGGKPVIFVQPEFNQSPAQAVAEAVGGTVAIHSPLERDVLKNIQRFADLITQNR